MWIEKIETSKLKHLNSPKAIVKASQNDKDTDLHV